jgi:hypothetical protein
MLKGLAIAAVVILHSVPKVVLYKSFAVVRSWLECGAEMPWTRAGYKRRMLEIPISYANVSGRRRTE